MNLDLKNNTPKIFIALVLATLIGFSGLTVGWTYSQVRDFPTNFVSKVDFVKAIDDLKVVIRDSLCDTREESKRARDSLERSIGAVTFRLDKIFELMIEETRTKKEGGR